jgi:hypothetical protein
MRLGHGQVDDHREKQFYIRQGKVGVYIGFFSVGTTSTSLIAVGLPAWAA